MSKKINKVEICSQGAEAFIDSLSESLIESNSKFDRKDKIYKYTKKYQKIFDNTYDALWEQLEDYVHENI